MLPEGSTAVCEREVEDGSSNSPVWTNLPVLEKARLPKTGWIAEEMEGLLKDYRLRYAAGILNEQLISRLEATPGWSWTL